MTHTSTAAATPHGHSVATAPRSRRVLVLRSARAPQVERGIRVARERNPGAEIVALSHRGHRDALLAAGADRVIELPGHRFELTRTAPWTLLRLRSEGFDEIVVPQMSSYTSVYLNLHRFVAFLRSERVVIVADEAPAEALTLTDFRSDLLQHMLAQAGPGWDAAFLIVLLAFAIVWRRRPVAIPASERPRVVHVIASLGLGGAQRQLAELVNATPPDRYDVEILVLFEPGGDFARQWLKRDDVPIRFLRRWPHWPLVVFELWSHCRRHRVDVLHTWLFMANALGACAARLAGVRHVVASVRSLNPGHITWQRQWWTRPVDILGLHAADAVTVNARALADDHVRWAFLRRSRIDVIHNGLDPSRFLFDRADARARLAAATGAPPAARFVGTSGRLAREKDHGLFLRLIDAARRSHPDVHGVIIGEGELRSEIEQLASDMGLATAVSFLGAREDAVRLVGGLDVFVLPSLVEGFPNALLEAVLSGVPAIASRVGGNTDILEDPASTFPSGDVDAAAAALLPLIADRARAAAVATRIRQFALERFTARHMTNAWFRVYDRGLKPPAAR